MSMGPTSCFLSSTPALSSLPAFFPPSFPPSANIARVSTVSQGFYKDAGESSGEENRHRDEVLTRNKHRHDRLLQITINVPGRVISHPGGDPWVPQWFRACHGPRV